MVAGALHAQYVFGIFFINSKTIDYITRVSKTWHNDC